MSFTRFHDDPNRIKKQIDESSFAGRYMLNTPGPGVHAPFIEDSHIRLQKWGANFQTNPVNLESDLKGLTRRNNKDNIKHNIHTEYATKSNKHFYKNTQPFVEESRASHPAWGYKDLELNRWEQPFLNPQNGLEAPFANNLQSRILEKDNHITKVPIIGEQRFYLTGNTMCIGDNNFKCYGSLLNK